MNKKLVSTIVLLSVVAALTPVIIYHSYTGTVTTTYLLEADVSQEEVIDMSTLIVQGKIISSHVEKSKSSTSDFVRAFTVWDIKVDDVLKGEIVDDGDRNHKYSNNNIVSFKTMGGELSPGVVSGNPSSHKLGDEVLVMLLKSPASVYGDNYYPVSYIQGVYTVEDGKAKSSIGEKHDKNEKDLVKKIKDRLK